MAKPKYKSLRGMPDIIPPEAEIISCIENKAREVFRTFCYSEIRTPLLEETEVFTRSIGEDTDIVEKEMYSFTDRGGKNISLRPEGTASIIRSYIEHGWFNTGGVVKLCYFGPMFRGERPQKGRLRQFNQIGAEIIGASSPYIDAEIILNLEAVLKGLGVEGFTLLINSLGCGKDRDGYTGALAAYLKEKEAYLCDDCKRRSRSNVLRVLDCKREGCKKVVKEAPSVLEHLCEACQSDHEALKEILVEMGMDFTEKKDLVRGLDYYTGTVFEVVHPSLGSQDAIAAGGRYDELTREMGGPDTGATGYAIGIERLLLVIDKKKIAREHAEAVVIPVGDEHKKEAFDLTNKFRASGIPCQMDHSGRSFKGQMRKADKEGKRFVVLLGEDEIKSGKVLVKDMKLGEQKMLTFEEAVEELKREQV
ncbi:MAG: histidine--tRNA ligase [Candidatus Omnitrophica bacterium]|nr:histidine--tRNA ligase [Candidatus Omnitrophota bacterium]